MPRLHRRIRSTALLPLLASASLFAACDPPETVDVTTESEIDQIVVTPGAALLTTLGGTRPFTASALAADGQPVQGVALTWGTSDDAVAAVDLEGVVTAVGPGSARITATVGGVTGEADLTVRESADPPVLFVGGTVLTLDPVTRVEEAVVVLGDRIFATGPMAAMRELVGPDVAAAAVELEGRTVMPGFVDPHNHIYNAVFLGYEQERAGTTYAEAQERLIRAGTTTMANANIWESALVDFMTFVDAGELRVRTSVYLGYNDFCGPLWPEGWYLDHPPITDPEAMFRIPGIKFFTDGGACNRGAFSFFADGGDLYFDAPDLAAAVIQVQELGYQALIHALGDIAVDTVLAALDIALDGGPNSYRHRMDHNRYLRPEQLGRYAELGALPVVFGSPFTCPMLDGGDWSFLTLDQFAALRPRFDPWRALIDANPGLPVAWKSDTPTHWPIEPISHLWSLVTRDEVRGDGSLCEAPDWLEAGAVTVEEALEMMTINAAHALMMEEAVGSLADGKFADLVVLSDDPRSVPPADIRAIQVRMTMIGGRVEHCAEGHEPLCPGW